MNNLKLYQWDAKSRTAFNKLKVGDVFCFQLDSQKYAIGRIMTRNSLGHVAEIFDEIVDKPIVDKVPKIRLGEPVILDSYSLFDRKAEGDWRVVAHDKDYKPSGDESVRFVYGDTGNVRLVDIFDNEVLLTDERKCYPSYSPMGDWDIKEHFGL
ncbi:Imm26 family immunity protein [Pseudomonas monteilii]